MDSTIRATEGTTMTKIAAYVNAVGDLVTMDTAETIRRATAGEREESRWAREHEGRTGAFAARVSERTLRRRCPMYRRQYLDVQDV